MPGVQAGNIPDLLASTRFEEHKDAITNLATELQDYLFFDMMLRRKNIKNQKGGLGLEKTLMNASGAKSRWVNLFEPDQVNIYDLFRKMRVQWKYLTDAIGYDEREQWINSGDKYTIVDMIKARREECMIRMIATLEEDFWGIPDASAENVMYGLFYWLVPNATQGFNGALPNYDDPDVEFSDVAGVNLTRTPRFKNWTDTYSAVSRDDLLSKMQIAFRKTRWKSPRSVKEWEKETGLRRAIYTTEEVLEAMEQISTAQNDNLGSELAPKDAVFKKIPITYVPQFDSEAYDYNNSHSSLASPIAMVDLDSFFVFVSSNQNFKKTVKPSPDSHLVTHEHFDLSLNSFCANRRANALITYSA